MGMKMNTSKRKVRACDCRADGEASHVAFKIKNQSQYVGVYQLLKPVLSALSRSAPGNPSVIVLGESSVMFYMNDAKQWLGGRQVLGAIPVPGAGSTVGARIRPASQRSFLKADQRPSERC